MKKLFLAGSIIAALTACSSQMDFPEESLSKPLVTQDLPTLGDPTDAIHIRHITESEALRSKTVNIADSTPKTLRAIFAAAMPSYDVIPRDVAVDLDDETLVIRAGSLRVSDFLEYIEGATGYQAEVEGNKVYLSAFVSKEYNMVYFSSNRTAAARSVATQSTRPTSSAGSNQSGSGQGQGGGSSSPNGTGTGSWSSIEMLPVASEWDTSVMGAAERIVGVEKDEDDEKEDKDSGYMTSGISEDDLMSVKAAQQRWHKKNLFLPKPFVIGSRQSGTVSVGGSASKIKQLDKYFAELNRYAETMFYFTFEVYQVTHSNNRQKGIDWTALQTSSLDGNPLTFGFSSPSPSESTSGLFNLGVSRTGDRLSTDTIINFLEQYGDVELDDQPSGVTLHGVPMQFSLADEFEIITNVDQTIDDGASQRTTELGTLRIGVSIAVTMQMTDSGKILADIWPVIGKITGERVFEMDGLTFSIPERSLMDLSTRVVVEPGQSVFLGGLISKAISKQLDGLPINHRGVKGVLDVPFGNVNNALERRELAMVFTPYITGK